MNPVPPPGLPGSQPSPADYSSLNRIRSSDAPKTAISPLQSIGGPFISAGLVGCVYHPFNTIVHTVQLTKLPISSAAKNLYEAGGIPRFYAGLGPALGNACTAKGVSFGMNKLLLSARPKEERTLPFRMVCVTLSVGTKVAICMPLENIKLYRQTNALNPNKKHLDSVLKIVQDTYKRGGVTRFYDTAPLAFIKSCLAHGPYLITYGYLGDHKMVSNPALNNFLAGLGASLSTVATALPVDHVKTTVLTQPNPEGKSSLRRAGQYLVEQWQKEGPFRMVRALYISSPAAAVQIIVGGTAMAVTMDFVDKAWTYVFSPSDPGNSSSTA